MASALLRKQKISWPQWRGCSRTPKLTLEPGYSTETLPPEEWPSTGSLTLCDLSLTYLKGAPAILKNISVCIAHKEKVGVAGRTGAGKSSLVTALFRMPEPEGEVVIVISKQLLLSSFSSERWNMIFLFHWATVFRKKTTKILREEEVINEWINKQFGDHSYVVISYLYYKDIIVHGIATHTTQAVLKLTSLFSIYVYNTNSQRDHLLVGWIALLV